MQKFFSRKFLVALAVIVGSIALALGADGNQMKELAGAVGAVISAVSYIFSQGRVDAASASNVLSDSERLIKLIRAVVQEENK